MSILSAFVAGQNRSTSSQNRVCSGSAGGSIGYVGNTFARAGYHGAADMPS